MKTAFRLLGPFVIFIGFFQLYLAKRADTEALNRGIIYIAIGGVILVLSALPKTIAGTAFDSRLGDREIGAVYF